jgi:ComF family protein
MRSTADFGDAKQIAVHRLKYNNDTRYAALLGQRLADELKRSNWQPSLITAVPLHPARLKERGYNQSALLGEYLAKQSNIPFRAEAVQRVRETRTQVGLGRQDRLTNVADAFEADTGLARDQKIVIVDDVRTTGATLRACASALLAAGASTVWALTVASAGDSERSTIGK